MKLCVHDPAHECWFTCPRCVEEVEVAMVIAKSYLTELANARFNDNGDCIAPVSEPVRGRHFQQIAATALGQLG